MASEQFQWQSVTGHEPTVQIQILEEALEVAVKHSKNLAKTITDAIGTAEPSTESSSFGGVEHLREWVQKAESVRNDRSGLQLLVGVQGQTGAGKSSLLNALLGQKDLLPCDNAEASTATICQVSYNYSDDLAQLFQARIFFRSHKDVKDELTKFFEDLEEQEKLLNPGPDDPEVDDEEREKLLEDLNANIRVVADKIQAVWGKSLTEMKSGKMSVANFLEKGDPAEKHLSMCKSIFDENQQEFAERVKPFLDSTYAEVTGSKGQGARTMALWPLIDHVEISLKAEILKGGIVLVDLPGLSDAVGARMAVARRFYEKLAVAIVVTPAIRAADESTGVSLMSRNQELQFRMDGKLHENSFCVVLSKIDDGIDWAATAKKQGRGDQVSHVQGLTKAINECASAMKECKGLMKKKQAILKKTSDEAEREKLRGRIAQLKKRRAYYTKVRKDKADQYTRIVGEEVFTAVQSRNQVLQARILNDLIYRHENFIKRSRTSQTVFKPPNIFPVTSKIYWNISSEISRKNDGFPKAVHTGIPALISWLREVTIPRRQRQVISLLNRFAELFSNLQTWCNDQCKIYKVAVSLEDLRSSVLVENCAELSTRLTAFAKKLEGKVRNCDPFKGRDTALKTCSGHVVNMVELWVKKNPDDPTSKTRMSWLTFRAIIRRNGGEFPCVSRGVKRKYNWMEDMANEFKTEIAGDWIEQLHQRIPELEGPAQKDIDKICNQVLKKVWTKMKHFFPDLAEQKEYFLAQTASLLFVPEQLKDKVGQALIKISERSPAVHASLQEQLQKKWQGGFKKANKVQKGKGILTTQHQALLGHATSNGKKIFKEAVKEMEDGFKVELQKFPQDLEAAWQEVLVKFTRQLELIIANILQAANVQEVMPEGEQSLVPYETEATRDARQDLQRGVRHMLTEWAAVWASDVDVKMTEDTAIPSEFVLKEDTDWFDPEAEDDSDSDYGSDRDMDMDMDDD